MVYPIIEILIKTIFIVVEIIYMKKEKNQNEEMKMKNSENIEGENQESKGN